MLKLDSKRDLITFMTDAQDSRTFAKMICFFSIPEKYCHPREVMEFWLSLTEQEKDYYRQAVAELEL